MGMDFVYHTFVPVCTLKDRNSEAPISLFVELILMLYDFNSINHPNLMGARRSCGQSICPATCWYLKHPVKLFFVERRLRWRSEHAALGLMHLQSCELSCSARRLSQHNVASQPDTL